MRLRESNASTTTNSDTLKLLIHTTHFLPVIVYCFFISFPQQYFLVLGFRMQPILIVMSGVVKLWFILLITTMYSRIMHIIACIVSRNSADFSICVIMDVFRIPPYLSYRFVRRFVSYVVGFFQFSKE